jgi:hypothetical protein
MVSWHPETTDSEDADTKARSDDSMRDSEAAVIAAWLTVSSVALADACTVDLQEALAYDAAGNWNGTPVAMYLPGVYLSTTSDDDRTEDMPAWSIRTGPSLPMITLWLVNGCGSPTWSNPVDPFICSGLPYTLEPAENITPDRAVLLMMADAEPSEPELKEWSVIWVSKESMTVPPWLPPSTVVPKELMTATAFAPWTEPLTPPRITESVVPVTPNLSTAAITEFFELLMLDRWADSTVMPETP